MNYTGRLINCRGRWDLQSFDFPKCRYPDGSAAALPAYWMFRARHLAVSFADAFDHSMSVNNPKG